MICGNCKGNHDTVQEVRSCYGSALALAERPNEVSSVEPVWPDRTPRHGARTPVPETYTARNEPVVTEKQAAFIDKLLSERESLESAVNMHPEGWRCNIKTKAQASEFISGLLKVEKDKANKPPIINEILADVEDGYYAIPSQTGNNDLDFIRIGTNQGRQHPERKGWRRVQRVIGGQGNQTMRNTEATAFARVLSALPASELKEAQVRFGRELGQCGVCGKHLTDETSRAAGIGPTCRAGF